MTERDQAERDLIEYRNITADRDNRVRRARAAGIGPMDIHRLSGIGRATINRALAKKETDVRAELAWTTDGVDYTARLLRNGEFLRKVTWDDLVYADEMRIHASDGWTGASLSQAGDLLWTFPINNGPHPFGRVRIDREDLANGLTKLVNAQRAEERAAVIVDPDADDFYDR